MSKSHCTAYFNSPWVIRPTDTISHTGVIKVVVQGNFQERKRKKQKQTKTKHNYNSNNTNKHNKHITDALQPSLKGIVLKNDSINQNDDVILNQLLLVLSKFNVNQCYCKRSLVAFK